MSNLHSIGLGSFYCRFRVRISSAINCDKCVHSYLPVGRWNFDRLLIYPVSLCYPVHCMCECPMYYAFSCKAFFTKLWYEVNPRKKAVPVGSRFELVRWIRCYTSHIIKISRQQLMFSFSIRSFAILICSDTLMRLAMIFRSNKHPFLLV